MRIQADLASIVSNATRESATMRIQTSLERLSKGIRINRASDDAAGLSVSEKLRAHIRGLTQAISNVNEAKALFQVQDGIVSGMQEQMQRLRELSVQAASDTLTDRERSYLQREVEMILESTENAARQKTWLNTYAMDDSANFIGVTTQTGGGAVPGDIQIHPYNPGVFEPYLDRPIKVEIIQDATMQELDTTAERSTHVQENLLAPMASATTVVGNGVVGDLQTINFTTTVNDPLDAISLLRRRHDNGVINPADYTLLSATPVGELTTFQIRIDNPAVTFYNKNNEYKISNATTGLASISYAGSDVTALHQVRSTSYTEEFLADGDGTVSLASGAVAAISSVQAVSGGGWVSLQTLAAGNTGDLVYDWSGGNNITVGIKQADGSIVASSPVDVRVQATLAAASAISDFASAAEGEMAYQWDGNRNLTIGIRRGATLQKGAHRIWADYTAKETQYNLTYTSNNKYKLAQGTRDAAGYVQFARDLYANTPIPTDRAGSARMEVRINGSAPEVDYQFYSLIDGQKNVIVFKTGGAVPGVRSATGPLAGASVSVDYATPTGSGVNWGGVGSRLGEATNDDGSITFGEAESEDGVFNDFWVGQSSGNFTVTQANRNRMMSMTLDPTWTVQDFINAFNNKAEQNDVEAEAYWDGASSEVRLRPGTSGWKERPITGWEGSLYNLTVSTTNIGAGINGDRAADQNSLGATQITAAQNSIIRVTLADTGQVIEAAHSSTSNDHDIDALGIRISVKHDAVVNSSSTLEFKSYVIQAGAYGNRTNQIRFSVPDVSPSALNTESINLETAWQASNSIGYADDAIKQLSGVRMYLGSLINRCDTNANLLQNGVAQGTESESLIRDVDFAAESTNMAKAQIFQQSAFAMQVQSNMLHKTIYSMLIPGLAP